MAEKSDYETLLEMVGSYDHPPCVVCGQPFLAYGTPDQKNRANLCEREECLDVIDDDLLAELWWRQWHDYLNGLIVY